MKSKKRTPEINLSGTEEYDYDKWLEFFRKKVTASRLIDLQDWLMSELPPDGYAALMRWLEIFQDPSKMDKLYKGRLDKQEEENIMDVAIGDDDEAFYIALIRQNTAQLSSSSISQQEVARLSQNINIFRKELREIRSRKVKSGTILEKVLNAANSSKNVKKVVKKTNRTPVKRKTAVSKASRATKTKKMTVASSKVKK